MANQETEQGVSGPRRGGALRARVVSGEAREGEARFERTFQVGRGKECDLQLLDTLVSRTHLRVERTGAAWTVRDLGSANGTFLAGNRVETLPLAGPVLLELGSGGPVLSLEPELAAEAPAPAAATPRRFASETQFLEHVLDAGRPAGRETQMMRAAIARVHRKRSRWYLVAIGAAAVLLAGAGGVIAWQGRKVARLEQSAERLFYAARALEVQSERLEALALQGADPAVAAALGDRRQKLRQMEEEYQGFVRELGVYEGKPEDERIILRVARIFGECDVNVPRSFVEEVRRYVKRWKSSDRMANALARAEEKGYTPRIVRTLAEEQLPHQYLFLALQESNFDERAVGRPTRYGHAKGMWQFIAQTGSRYGLRIGPLRDQGVYDPADERFHVEKATRAAARYIRDLRATEAQASGLLVMASYNWGETKVRQIIEKLPENPQERNFWRLLARKDVPQETYDYVLSIFSAAVICENPAFFGVALRCPAAPARVGG